MTNMTKENELIEKIIDRYDADTGMLIPIMQDLQADCGYLPPEHLRCLASCLDVPMSRIYAVATFYSSFRLAPKGQHDVTLCMGTVCYLKGAPQICDAISREFQVEPGGTTHDRLFTLQAVNCVGACALAPVMIVDGKYYDGVTPESALEILNELPSAEEDAETAAKEVKS
jgi:NADH:ubiquinone oxidoreductase subunit E